MATTLGYIDQRLAQLRIVLPPPVIPMGAYAPYILVGTMLHLSGQLPMKEGRPRYIGKLGQELTVEDGREAARLCALNLIAQARHALMDDLDRVKRVVRLGGFVNATAEFGQEPQVINGASDVMVEVFEERGRHARTAVGVHSLPFRVGVEVEALFEVVI